MNQPPKSSDKKIRGAFKMPKLVKITGRISTITNSFVQAIIPVDPPSDADVRKVLKLLGMTPENIRCAYCGDSATEWDHINPLVANKQPTGYWSTISNLVPACGKCNQSKGGKPWKVWMTGPARQSPASREIADLPQRVERLESYERWSVVRHENFEALVGDELWQEYQRAKKKVEDAMRDAQAVAEHVRAELALALESIKAIKPQSPAAGEPTL